MDALWAAARPYLRARKNDIHVPMAVDYARRLLEAHPDADADVVLAATLLHDIGWAVVDQEAILRDGFGPGMMVSDIRIAHEKEGARLAREILDELGWDAAERDEIVAIIDGHDTRRQPLSGNDTLVKDADALWRFNVVGVAISADWFGETPDVYVARLDGDVERLYTQAAREIARAELDEAARLLAVDRVTSP
jgi:HD superfamily phosphodiesterase